MNRSLLLWAAVLALPTLGATALVRPGALSTDLEEPRTSSTTSKYVLRHYFDEPEPDGGFVVQRVTDSDGSFQLVYFGLDDPSAQLFTRHFDSEGAETEGPSAGIAHPARLWFWRTQPEVGASVVVPLRFQAFDSQGGQASVVTRKIRFEYLRDEMLWSVDRIVRCHVVEESREDGGGSRDLHWFDANGMQVRSVHVVDTQTRTTILEKLVP